MTKEESNKGGRCLNSVILSNIHRPLHWPKLLKVTSIGHSNNIFFLWNFIKRDRTTFKESGKPSTHGSWQPTTTKSNGNIFIFLTGPLPNRSQYSVEALMIVFHHQSTGKSFPVPTRVILVASIHLLFTFSQSTFMRTLLNFTWIIKRSCCTFLKCF